MSVKVPCNIKQACHIIAIQTWEQDKHQNNLQNVDKGNETPIVQQIGRSHVAGGINFTPPVFKITFSLISFSSFTHLLPSIV